MHSVGEIITDETRPSVTPLSVANSIANKKTPTDRTPTVLQTDTRAPKKKFPAGILPTK